MLSQAGSGSEALRDDLRQSFAAGSEIDVFADTDNGTADEARFLQHEFYEVIIGQGILRQAHFFKAGTSEIEHLRCRLPLEQVFYFRAVERVLEEVAFVDFKPFLQEKLSRFATRASRYPAVKIDLHVIPPLFPDSKNAFESSRYVLRDYQSLFILSTGTNPSRTD